MKRIALAALALSGCATVSDVRARAPVATFPTTRPMQVVEACVAGAFSYIAQPSIVHRENATEISFGHAEQPTILVTVRPQGSVTVIELREQMRTAGARHRLKECAVTR